MEHHEDNAQLDNYLQNRLAESLQICGGAGEHNPHLADATGGNGCAPGIAPSKSDEVDGEEDEEWKYIHEVRQSEKLQQEKLPLTKETGNGFGPGRDSDNQVHGNGAAAVFNLYEEDVEVIKNDGDFSTNSNTTTSTDEVVARQAQEPNQLPEQLQQQQQIESQGVHEDPRQEDEDEHSSVATTYGTSSLSENNSSPLDQEEVVMVAQTVGQEQLVDFDNKENSYFVKNLEENHSQLNPNAVAFVPGVGSQSSSPLPAAEDPLPGVQPRPFLPGGTLDDLVAESPRKEFARINMDGIAVPDEREFDIEADMRPHELEQESDTFGAGHLEMQLLNGIGTADQAALRDVLDHGPETSVDMELPLDQVPNDADIMKQSIYAEHNSSIEDILNSVQPLPIQTCDDKELIHVEEKEHVSKSPSTEELQFQSDFPNNQESHTLFNNTEQDPMQASFYLEHTSQKAQEGCQEQMQLPAECSDIFADQSLLLDTSAPQLSSEADSPVAKLELESQQAGIVDITPSPLSSTAEKHLVEDTKELVEEYTLDPESHFFGVVSSQAPLQNDEENAVFESVSGYETQNFDEISSPPEGINPFAQPFTPAHLVIEQANTMMEDVGGMPIPASEDFAICDKVANEIPLSSASKEKLLPDTTDEQLLTSALEEKLRSVAPEESVSTAADGQSISQFDEYVIASNKPLEDILEPEKDVEVAKSLSEKTSVATVAGGAVVGATKTHSATKAGSTAASAKSKTETLVMKKTTASSTSVYGANKSAAPRPSTARLGIKSTSIATKTSTTSSLTGNPRKSLSSNVGSTVKPPTKLSGTRPATAPVSKVTLGAKTITNKPTASGTASDNVTRTTLRPLVSTNARRPATSGTGSVASSTARRPVTNAKGSAPGSAASTKVRPAATMTAPVKPKVLSPRSTISSTTTVRKVPSTSTPSFSTRSPNKQQSNGLGKNTSSTTTSTATATITKSFTARSAPKFTHSASLTYNNGSTSRRLLVPGSSSTTTTSSLRKSSPLKAAPGKAASKPLTPQSKDGTAKSSPAVLKARNSTLMGGEGVAPSNECVPTPNGQINAEEVVKLKGKGLAEEVKIIEEQKLHEQDVPAHNAEVPLLDF
uniref:Microtubule-associated protein 205, isoform C n=2 Tax=Drosophila melanogaster TaxID=7227 RepID=A0A0B4KI71_DROME|nr:Microtubule-associated protein 205, isoform C [Drosophila melanogaster]AGB96532.1 Microtubule-associated protein 205, isoform C [Drosophila melanogaster]|eukprot:NP_001263154.1 Microtubule-associated protein 205, isoform C [Drosophila melanogaster]